MLKTTAMQLSHEELDLLVSSVRGTLQTAWPVEQAVEQAANQNALRDALSALRALGFGDLGASDNLPLADTSRVFEELGRASCPAPLLGVYVANRLLEDASDPELASFLSAVRIGDARPAVALTAFDGDPAAGSVTIEGNRISGTLNCVEDIAIASHLLVFDAKGPGIAVVALSEPGVEILAEPGLAVPSLSTVTLDTAVLAYLPLNATILDETAMAVRLLVAARALGAAQQAFDLSVDYAKVRRQFGHVIGEFQAIQHKLADCLLRLDGSRLSLLGAAKAFDRGDHHWQVFANAALAFSSPALRQVILEAHHTHGAIGYAEEHELPRHFRRVHSDTVRFGGVSRARAALSDYLLSPSVISLPSHDTEEAVVSWRGKVRDWLDANWTPALRDANRHCAFKMRRWDPDFTRKIGEAGWIGLDWPKQYGGKALSAGEQLAFIEEMEMAEAPGDAHLCGEMIVGPAIYAFGTDEQKSAFLPAILRGERFFALHYSEPESGSDLASLRTTARRDGDDYVISGQKMWSTNGDKAEYALLAARTDPAAQPPHAGISTFLVPLKTPGISIRPSDAMYGRTFSATFYDDVRLPASALLGEENGGWKVITNALAAERSMIGTQSALLQHVLGLLTDHISVSDRLSADPVVRDRIASLAAEVEIARQFVLRNTELAHAGRVPLYEASMTKYFVGELQERLGEAALDILGTGGLLSEDAPSAPIGAMEQVLRHAIMGVIGGGTSEMQRNAVALRGLRLPRMS